ncbi:MAG TPA: 50S ribosomal protein L21 [Candidatus Krumholzibacteria bacterium]|nr:50S ribosomal protein L21 [Candidatus Krumholzibacteria bacterium]
MYAIVKIAGLQFKATPNTILRVPKLEAEVGGNVTFEEVLLWSDGKETHVGAPFVAGKSVSGEVVRHGRGDKIIVFKKRRRKGYRRRNGHRQWYTDIRLSGFGV